MFIIYMLTDCTIRVEVQNSRSIGLVVDIAKQNP